MAFPRQVPHIPRLSETHELREDVVYAHAGGVPLRFDHYRPRKVAGAAPAVVFVHGGAWMHGDPSPAARHALHLPPRRIATLSLSYPAPPPPPPARGPRRRPRALSPPAPPPPVPPPRRWGRRPGAGGGGGRGGGLPPPGGAPPPSQTAGRGGANRRANQAMDAFLERHL